MSTQKQSAGNSPKAADLSMPNYNPDELAVLLKTQAQCLAAAWPSHNLALDLSFSKFREQFEWQLGRAVSDGEWARIVLSAHSEVNGHVHRMQERALGAATRRLRSKLSGRK